MTQEVKHIQAVLIIPVRRIHVADIRAAAVTDMIRLWPNQSPEPTAVAVAVTIYAVNRRWFSFCR
jgi:hypothetical protein